MDRFSEGEARRIFAEAARAGAPGGRPDDGLTLDELQEIGRAAGIDPRAVAAVAATVRHDAALPVWHGAPLATCRTRVVPGALSDDAWAEAVAVLRREFKTQGVTEQIGRQRTWTQAVGESTQTVLFQFTAEAVDGGTRLTAESGAGSERTAARVLGGGFAALAGVFAAIGVAEGNAVNGALVGAVLALFAVSFYALIRWSAVARGRRDPARFDAVLDRVARLASAGPALPDAGSPSGVSSPVASAPPPSGALGDLLDAPLSEADGPSAPRRTRA